MGLFTWINPIKGNLQACSERNIVAVIYKDFFLWNSIKTLSDFCIRKEGFLLSGKSICFSRSNVLLVGC